MVRHEMEKRRSQVYQRRNEFAQTERFKGVFPGRSPSLRKNLGETQKLIDDEMIELIKRSERYSSGRRSEFYCLSNEQLAQAKAMLAAEAGDMPDSFAELFHKTSEQMRVPCE